MRYDDPKLQEILAGEYALGTLRGPARRRFEALMRTRAGLRARVAEWEKDLAPLAEETPPVEPPAELLEHLEQYLDPERPGSNPTIWKRLAFWRPFGIAAAALVVLLAGLAVYLGLRPATFELAHLRYDSQPRYVAVLQDDTAVPALVVMAYPGPFRHLVVEPLAGLTIPADGALRLWTVERGSGAMHPLLPISGGMPFSQTLSEEGWQLLETARSLAVSLELPGGGDARVGPILYSGPCLSLEGPPE